MRQLDRGERGIKYSWKRIWARCKRECSGCRSWTSGSIFRTRAYGLKYCLDGRDILIYLLGKDFEYPFLSLYPRGYIGLSQDEYYDNEE